LIYDPEAETTRPPSADLPIHLPNIHNKVTLNVTLEIIEEEISEIPAVQAKGPLNVSFETIEEEISEIPAVQAKGL